MQEESSQHFPSVFLQISQLHLPVCQFVLEFGFHQGSLQPQEQHRISYSHSARDKTMTTGHWFARALNFNLSRSPEKQSLWPGELQVTQCRQKRRYFYMSHNVLITVLGLEYFRPITGAVEVVIICSKLCTFHTQAQSGCREISPQDPYFRCLHTPHTPPYQFLLVIAQWSPAMDCKPSFIQHFLVYYVDYNIKNLIISFDLLIPLPYLYLSPPSLDISFIDNFLKLA